MRYVVLKNGGITSPQGFKAGVGLVGLKANKTNDLALVVSEKPANGAGVFTTNKFAAAPVQVAREYLAKNKKLYGFVVNSGCANACTGEQGLKDAYQMTVIAGQATGCRAEQFLPASTGMIGTYLPMEKVEKGIRQAAQNLSKANGGFAAKAILTTDTIVKQLALEVEIGGEKIVIGGMAKGAGMIHPQMATMLAFISTDALITPECLQTALELASESTFNQITVDGETSTNDTVVALANGLAGNFPITAKNSEAFYIFVQALQQISLYLAKMIARDGEGATKLMEVEVSNAASLSEARQAARIIASSNLLKAALFGGKPNWGRIACALGYSGIKFVPERVLIYLGELLIMAQGKGVDFDQALAEEILRKEEIVIRVDLQAGKFTAKAWGCDLTEKYVLLNSNYKT